MFCILRLPKDLDWFVRQRNHFLWQFQGAPEHLSSDNTAGNLNLKPSYRFISTHSDQPIEFAHRKLLLKKTNHGIGRTLPETGVKIRFGPQGSARVCERIGEERKILSNNRSQIQLHQELGN